MEHYYSSKPTTAHNINNIDYTLKGHELRFMTDSGVFSKGRVDFGSDLLIRSIPSLEGRVLDLGCGYGPIGISLAFFNDSAYIEMVDINERAVDLAKKNIVFNGISNAEAFISNGFTNVSHKFNTIVTNPPIRAGKKLIYSLFEESREYMHTGGMLYIVIQKKQGAPSAIRKLEDIFGNCTIIDRKKGYQILRSVKM